MPLWNQVYKSRLLDYNLVMIDRFIHIPHSRQTLLSHGNRERTTDVPIITFWSAVSEVSRN